MKSKYNLSLSQQFGDVAFRKKLADEVFQLSPAFCSVVYCVLNSDTFFISHLIAVRIRNFSSRNHAIKHSGTVLSFLISRIVPCPCDKWIKQVTQLVDKQVTRRHLAVAPNSARFLVRDVT